MTVLFGLRQRLYMAKLYLIVDAQVNSGELADFVVGAFRGGVDMIGFRDDTLDRATALAQLAAVRTAGYPSQGLLVVHDDVALAEAFTADLLHVDGNTQPSVELARRLHQWALLGRAAHDESGVRSLLADEDVDFLTVGATHRTATALELVEAASTWAPPSEGTSKPWFANGGTSLHEVDEVLAAGARRIVVGAEIRDAAGAEDAARAIRERIDAAWDNDPAMEGYFQRAVTVTGL